VLLQRISVFAVTPHLGGPQEMSRSGYHDDLDQWALIRYRGAVKSAFRGKRGQSFLREMVEALDALPEKRLTDFALQSASGEVCAIGAVGLARGVDIAILDPDNPEQVAGIFGIADCMVREIAFENDESVWREETPEHRFHRMRGWAESNIKVQ